MTADRYLTLKTRLDELEVWPHEYTFKFIVPAERRKELEALFSDHEYSLRPSRTAKFISLTCKREVADSDAVIQIYERVSEIEGSFAL